MNEQLLNDGYLVVKNLFTKEEVQFCRDVSLEYFKKGGGFRNSTGRAKPDWVKESELKPLYDLWASKNVEKVVENLIGEPVEFVGHNDLHINRNVGWHKDRLNNDARKYEVNSPWDNVDGETMKIYKINFYLQSHADNTDGLVVKHGSHKNSSMSEGQNVVLRPDTGDIIVFDQRITHMAQWAGGYNRLLICMGYGVKNLFFEQFKLGTEYRQDKQNGVIND